MKILFIIILSFTFLNFSVNGQKYTKEFVIENPQIKITNSLYNSIKFVDSRIDTTNLGFVQNDKLNHKAKVIVKIPLSSQISKTVSSLINDNTKSRELIFQLRQLKFSVNTSGTNERGYCIFNAILYSKSYNNTYQKLASIDTLSGISSTDVTKAILRSGSQMIIDFIAENLIKITNDSVRYSLNDILNTDSLEKRKIKVYNTDSFTDGMYSNYNSFKDQIPDKKLIVKMKQDSSIAYVKVFENNNWVKIKPNNAYAIVYHGIPYIATKFGYYQLNKSDDKLYFIGKVKPNSHSGDDVVSNGLFSILTTKIVSNLGSASYFIILNHINGDFIYYKEMPGPGFLF